MVGETDVTRMLPRERNMGVVFQSYALFPHMTALENVCFGLESRGVGRSAARARATDALAMVDLTDYVRRRPRELSGGQQQRVALARALAVEPDILLLDEPLGALDRKLRLQLQGELRKLQARLGVTALLVTHDQEEALALADQVAVMRNGVIEQLDSPARLFRAPQTAWVADFIGAGSLLPAAAQATLVTSGALRFEGPSPPQKLLFLAADRLRLEPADATPLRVESVRYLGRGFEIEAVANDVRLRVLVSEAAATLLTPGRAVRAVVPLEGWHGLDDTPGTMTKAA